MSTWLTDYLMNWEGLLTVGMFTSKSLQEWVDYSLWKAFKAVTWAKSELSMFYNFQEVACLTLFITNYSQLPSMLSMPLLL